MRQTIIIAMLLMAIPFVSAQTIGCCCDPVFNTGTYASATDCTATGGIFKQAPATGTCTQACAETQTTPAPQTCTTPTQAPTLSILAQPNQAFQLTYALACPAYSVTISRCKGTNCTPALIAQTPPTGTYLDQGVDILYNTDYTYKITATTSSGETQPRTTTANLGDIECQQNTFCISSATYLRYKDYLMTNGYGQYTGQDFKNAFEQAVNYTFATRFNKAWQCVNNKLQQTPLLTCPTGQYCISDETGPHCAIPSSCATGTFGLTTDTATCEASYCYHDNNACNKCEQNMTCHSYGTQSSCQRDNCHTGQCQWNTIFPELSIGTCVDTTINNCQYCTGTGIWNSCNEPKSNALSTPLNPCFFDKDQQQSKNCKQATCADYSPQQCGTPAGGIQLNPDNTIKQRSNDPCNIGVCHYDASTGCVKNADGNTGLNIPDCFNSPACEQDYFPPTTSITPLMTAGKTEGIAIRVFDKTSAQGSTTERTGLPGYITNICAGNCTPGGYFTTNARTLTLKNGALSDGNKTLTLPQGTTEISYYSKDNANNLEQVKQLALYVCDNCNGPTLVSAEITGGKLHGNTFYTLESNPVVTLTFDEPTTLTTATYNGNPISLPAEPQTVHEFELTGQGTLVLNGRNAENILISQLGLTFFVVVDTNLPTIVITPDDAIINKTSIDVTLNYSAPVELLQVILETHNYDNQYQKQLTHQELTQFTNTDNKTFRTTLTNLGGKYVVKANAEARNTLSVYREATFYSASKTPSIVITKPAFGVTSSPTYSIELETDIPATCSGYTDDETIHTKGQQTMLPNQTTSEPFTASCDFPGFGTIEREFYITLDAESPTLADVSAEPQELTQAIDGIYSTTLKATLDKEGFCKYSTITPDFNLMEHTFPGYDILPKTTHAVQLNMTAGATYNVACKAKNQLTTPPKSVAITVVSSALTITSTTPTEVPTADYILSVKTNKQALCHYGEQEATNCMGSCAPAYTHASNITQAAETTNYKITCTTDDETADKDITVIINPNALPVDCTDGTLSPTETDTDCGGICAACGNGKTCNTQTDCQTGLSCNEHTCTTANDADNDGVLNDADECPNTPSSDPANSQGCGLSQVYSLADSINDKWRMDNFGCIECSEAALNADPDKDGLTNEEEYNLFTNPKVKDTDGDGYYDKAEVSKGTNPLDANSKPTTSFKSLLVILLFVSAVSAAGYYIYKRTQQPARHEFGLPTHVQQLPQKEQQKTELDILKTFAEKQDLDKQDWVPVQDLIKKKPLPPHQFSKELEKLRDLAKAPPLAKLKNILNELPQEKQDKLLHKPLTHMNAEERKQLMEKLKKTANKGDSNG